MTVRFPAEWEPHAATWIAWPHHEPDWPGKIEPIPWVYAEIVRVLAKHERVEILCQDEDAREAARTTIEAHGATDNYRLHVLPTDRVWLRDSAPTGVVDEVGGVRLVNWRFNAWAKYDNYALDAKVGEAVARITGLSRDEPKRPDTGERVVLEGGAIDTDGAGTLLVTEECLLSDVQARNPGLTREGYERVFRRFPRHPPDDLAWRRMRRRRHAWPRRRHRALHGAGHDRARLRGRSRGRRESPPFRGQPRASAAGRLDSGENRVVMLPFPRPVTMNGERLPASYANFYVANGVVIVPTFNDANDRAALNTLAELFPGREVVGIHAVDLVWGLGTLHCLTQQQPRGS